MDTILTILVWYLSCIHNVNLSFLQATHIPGHCVGSLQLNDNPSLTFHTSVHQLNLKVKVARMEGCGCFRLYQRPGARGRSQKIDKQGTTLVHLRRVGSVVKEQCSSYYKVDGSRDKAKHAARAETNRFKPGWKILKLPSISNNKPNTKETYEELHSPISTRKNRASTKTSVSTTSIKISSSTTTSIQDGSVSSTSTTINLPEYKLINVTLSTISANELVTSSFPNSTKISNHPSTTSYSRELQSTSTMRLNGPTTNSNSTVQQRTSVVIKNDPAITSSSTSHQTISPFITQNPSPSSTSLKTSSTLTTHYPSTPSYSSFATINPSKHSSSFSAINTSQYSSSTSIQATTKLPTITHKSTAMKTNPNMNLKMMTSESSALSSSKLTTNAPKPTHNLIVRETTTQREKTVVLNMTKHGDMGRRYMSSELIYTITDSLDPTTDTLDTTKGKLDTTTDTLERTTDALHKIKTNCESTTKREITSSPVTKHKVTSDKQNILKKIEITKKKRGKSVVIKEESFNKDDDIKQLANISESKHSALIMSNSTKLVAMKDLYAWSIILLLLK